MQQRHFITVILWLQYRCSKWMNRRKKKEIFAYGNAMLVGKLNVVVRQEKKLQLLDNAIQFGIIMDR